MSDFRSLQQEGGGERTPKPAKLLKTPAKDESGVSFGVSVKRERKKAVRACGAEPMLTTVHPPLLWPPCWLY